MGCNTTTNRSRDILLNPLLSLLLFCLPVIAMIAAGRAAVGAGWRTAVWATALSIMGGACIANAARCGRVHCFVTGPLFLLMAVVTLLYGLGVVRLGAHGWNGIGLTTLVGAVALCCLPELLWGRYRRPPR